MHGYHILASLTSHTCALTHDVQRIFLFSMLLCPKRERHGEAETRLDSKASPGGLFRCSRFLVRSPYISIDVKDKGGCCHLSQHSNQRGSRAQSASPNRVTRKVDSFFLLFARRGWNYVCPAEDLCRIMRGRTIQFDILSLLLQYVVNAVNLDCEQLCGWDMGVLCEYGCVYVEGPIFFMRIYVTFAFASTYTQVY